MAPRTAVFFSSHQMESAESPTFLSKSVFWGVNSKKPPFELKICGEKKTFFLQTTEFLILLSLFMISFSPFRISAHLRRRVFVLPSTENWLSSSLTESLTLIYSRSLGRDFYLVYSSSTPLVTPVLYKGDSSRVAIHENALSENENFVVVFPITL